MSVTQTVEIPVSHRLTIEVPPEIPAGRVILTFTPDAVHKTDTVRQPIPRYFGILSPNTYGDGVAYQWELRDDLK